MHEKDKSKDKDYLLGLHWAATTGNVGLVKFALDHGAPIDAVVNGFMPLQLACISDNNIAVVQYLIDRGAEVNAQRWSKKHSADKSQAVAGAIGSTALHVACANGCVKTVDLLLRNGALVDVKDKYGSSPLDIAAAKHHVEIVRLLETFGAMQQQNRKLLQPPRPAPYEGRRSMDVATMTQSEKAERFRRPSLPSVFEGKAPLHVPPLETLPPSRKSTTNDDNSNSSSSNSNSNSNSSSSNSNSNSNSNSSNSSSHHNDTNNNAAAAAAMGRRPPDYYGYGVVNPYGEDNYLLSLERRAFGLAAAADDASSSSSSSHAATRRPSTASLKRCSSDGGHLRTTALMNAMAANNSNSVIDGEPTPRPSVALDDGPEAEALRGFQEREMKKAWWSAFGGRKSMDVATYHYGRSTIDIPRKSLDLRPSLDSLSQLARKSVEGLSRRSIDERPSSPLDHQYSAPNRPSFLTRMMGAWSGKK